MTDRSQYKVEPGIWKEIIRRYPNEFCPRMIFKRGDKWIWQASDKVQIDIDNWLINWKVDGKDKLATMAEFNS